METVPLSDLLAHVGAAVRARREARGLTQAELAKRSGVSVRFLADVERGMGNASLLRLAELALALEVSLAELVVSAGPVVDDVVRFGRLPPAERRRRLGADRVVIALVGLRGAGKSTIGKRLAAHLGVQFHEVDAAVEARAGLRLSELFEYHGQARYRALEREVLDGLLAADEPAVVATGGSLVTDAETWAWLRFRARTVWLRASPASHLARVEAQGDVRPMTGRRDAQAELRAILDARTPLYRQAEHTVDTDALDVIECVWDIERWLRG